MCAATNQLIVNADDFGLTEGATRAIVDCHRVGALKSTTLMVNMQATELAVALAAGLPELGIGLHFTLTLGEPAAPRDQVRSLLGSDGQLRLRRGQEWAILTGVAKQEEIAREFDAQLERMRSMGIEPTHVDSHQHIHTLPRVFDVVAERAAKLGLPVRMPWRWHGPRKQGLRKNLKGAAMGALMRRNARKWRGVVRTNQHHCSLFDLTYNPADVALGTYERLLDTPSPCLELMVHPAIADDSLRKLIGIAEFCAAEYEVLRSQQFVQLIREKGFQLATFAEV